MQSLDLDVLERVLEWRKGGHRVWLVTVAQTFGASPRPPGSLAAIRDDAPALTTTHRSVVVNAARGIIDTLLFAPSARRGMSAVFES